MREAQIKRKTKETEVYVSLCLEGSGKIQIETGVGFFDHMLHSFALHGGFDLEVRVKGDLQVDCHHSIEDTGIVLGQAFRAALGEKKDICRFGEALIPMDEALGLCALDISGRPYLVFDCDFACPMIGAFDTQMAEEFFRAFAFNALITLHLKAVYGKNDHHKCEALFKAWAHALRKAVSLREEGGLLSAKGVL